MKMLTEGVNTHVKPGLRAVSECAKGLRGRAADAMEEQLVQLVTAAAALSEELGELTDRMYAYADLLEQTDAQLAEEL